MTQPKLSNQSIQPLLVIGPFDGIDATTDPYYIDGTYARDALNFVPNHAYRGFAPIRGRVAGTYQLTDTPTSLVLFYPHNAPPSLVAVAAAQFYSIPAMQTAPWTNILVPPSPNGDTISNSSGAFARYKSWLFFSNGDPHGICYKFDSKFAATFWGIEPPAKAPTEQTIVPFFGQIYGSAYYYRYTYAADNATDPGLSQESSPSPPFGPVDLGTSLGPPQSNNAAVTQSPAPTLAPDQSGGTIKNATYYVAIAWVTAAGAAGISAVQTITLSGGTGNPPVWEVLVTPAGAPAGATGYNIYAGDSASALTQQGGTRSGTTAQYWYNFTTDGALAPAFTGVLNPPAAPVVTATSGGSLPERTEYYQITYVNANGETTPSTEVPISLAANHLAVVASPAESFNATGYNVYASTTSAQEVIQNSLSQPLPIAIGTNWTGPTAGLALGASAVLTLNGSPDPQVTSINIYRIGGQSLGNWYNVGSQTNPGAGSTITFTDNTPDAQVTGQALVLARDPPAPFVAVFEHLDRVLGFGYDKYTDFNGTYHGGRPCDLWYSNYAEPWGFDATNQVLPVGAEDAGDIAVQGGSLGGIGILWKSKTTWALYGSSPSDFYVSKLFDVGATAQGACFVALGVAFWLSNQGMYMFDGSTLTYLSKPIKAILDGMSAQDLAAATGCFDDRIAWWSFPTQGISLGYDTVSQNWFKSSLWTTLFAFDPEAKSRPNAPDWVFGADPTLPLIDRWFAATTDLGEPITATLTTRLGNSGPQIGTMRVRYIELITSANISASDSVVLTVTANPASTARSFSKTFGTSAVNVRQRASVPPGIQGDELQLTLAAVTSDGLVFDGAAAHGWVRRMYNVVA